MYFSPAVVTMVSVKPQLDSSQRPGELRNDIWKIKHPCHCSSNSLQLELGHQSPLTTNPVFGCWHVVLLQGVVLSMLCREKLVGVYRVYSLCAFANNFAVSTKIVKVKTLHSSVSLFKNSQQQSSYISSSWVTKLRGSTSKLRSITPIIALLQSARRGDTLGVNHKF